MRHKLSQIKFERVEGKTYVFLVWSGIQRIKETHGLVGITSTLELAEQRVNRYDRMECEYHEDDAIDYWYEEVEVDHFFGNTMEHKARELKRKMRSGD